jgi:hypothetical protein
LLLRARRGVGKSDFGDLSFLEPLRILLESLSREASLGLIGETAARWDVVRFLGNILSMRAMEQTHPELLARDIPHPIFIAGLPRSGTTFLQRMMVEDPRNRAPAVWETLRPLPEPNRHPDKPDRRIAQAARQLRMFEWMAPEFRSLHPLDATSPQECSEILAHVFRSMRFETNYMVPTYRDWLDADSARHVPAYRFHKQFLQHLQHQDPGPPRQWVLKCPEHIFALSAIRLVYPDARVVFVHRDPVKVLLSVAKLTEVLRRPFARQVDRIAIGRDESARWLDGTRRMIAAGDDIGLPEPICHVHHIDLVTDPVATVEQIYKHFRMPFTEIAANAMDRYVSVRPNGGYGPRDYRFEDHGLSADREREKFMPYMLRFGIVPESLPRPRRTIRLAPTADRARVGE